MHRHTDRHKQSCIDIDIIYRNLRMDTQIDISNYAHTQKYRHLCIETEIDISNYA